MYDLRAETGMYDGIKDLFTKAAGGNVAIR
jgi:hypothetical protein